MPMLMAMEALTIKTLSLLFNRKGSSFRFCSSVDSRDTITQRRCLMLLVSMKSLPCGGNSNPSGLSSRRFGDGHSFHDVPFDCIIRRKV